MPKLYILCGLPYSGKSLFSKEIEKTKSIKRISFDEIFDNLKKLNEGITYEIGVKDVDKTLTEELKKGNSVIYDSTNLSFRRRSELKKLAELAGAQFVVIYIKTSEEEIFKRKAQGLIDRSHQNVLSDKDINDAIKKLEIPTNCITISTEEDKRDFLESLKYIKSI